MAATKGNTYTQNRKLNPTYSQDQIDEIITKLLKWAHYDDGIYIASFIYEEFKQPKSWVYNLARYHKDLEEALETTRQLIAGKIANHSFKGDRNSTFGEKILPMYCKEYKALKEWQAKLSQQSAESIKTTFTEMKNAIKDGSLLDMLKQQDDN